MENIETRGLALVNASINERSRDLMNKMRLYGMSEAFEECLQNNMEDITPDAMLYKLLTRESDYRNNLAIARLTRQANFRYNAYPEDIDFSRNRNLDRNLMERLISLDFVRDAQNIFITGPSGTGKSFIASALGHQACRAGIKTLYSNAAKLMGHMKLAKNNGTLEQEMRKVERCPLLILDDMFLVSLDAKERAILVEIIEDRHERKSIIVTSQLPVSSWYDAIGDPTVADAVLDRVIHSACQIELKGESMRKIKALKSSK